MQFRLFGPLLFAPLLGMLALAAPLLADGPHNGQVVQVSARYAFVPVGFDDNDETLLVLDGYLPSGCYKLVRPMYELDPVAKTIDVHPMARYFDVPCVEALIPYEQEIRLGVLPQGTYQVRIVPDGIAEELGVAEATSAGADEYLYAPVDGASVAEDRATGRLTATLFGRFTNSCMQWQELRVIDNGKTVNILPIMKMAKDAAADDVVNCSPQEVAFKKTVELPASITRGRHLLHVRSLNGQAANVLFFKNQ